MPQPRNTEVGGAGNNAGMQPYLEGEDAPEYVMLVNP